MKSAAAYLRANAARFALNATREMGKPIGDAEAEVEKCAWACDFYAEQRREISGRRAHRLDRHGQLRRLPAARRRAGGHALELPLLAGLPLRRARR